MKKFINIISLVAVAAFTLVSCQKEQDTSREPSPAEVSGCYGVYFPTQEASGSHVFSPVDDPSIDVVLARTNTSGSITVPITALYSDEGVFTATPATFADGQSETTFTVRFDNAKEGVNYSASFVIEDNQYASMYNSNPIGLDFSLMRVEMKTFKTPDGSKDAAITFSDKDFWGEVHDECYIQYYEVDGVRYCETVGGKLVGEGTEGVGPWGTDVQLKFKWYTKKTVTVNEETYQWIEVEAQYHGWESSGNPVYFGDYYHMRADMGLGNGSYTSSYDRYVNGTDGYLPSYYDGNGGFVFNVAYWIHGTTSWYGYQNNAPLGIAEGYVRVDYSLKLESDYSVDGVSPIYVTAGVDVANLKYAVYEGELTATQIGNKVDAIASGSESSETFDDFVLDEDSNIQKAVMELEPETTGIYTLVAVACDDSGNAQNSAIVVFKHIAGDDTEEYAVNIDVFTEPTPARYQGFTEYDSFAFGIVGSDIVEAHVAIVESSKLNAKLLNDLKNSSSAAVDASVIAQINAVGGFYTVAGELDPGTEYAVVVWATNGDADTFEYDLYTTAEIPEVWKPIGTGLFTDDMFTTFFNVEPQTMEVEMAQSEDDPTRFKMIYPYDGKYPYNEVGDWDDSKSYDVVFTIPDADHVYITPQKIGVDWGYGMFSIASAAGRYVAAGYSFDVIEANDIAFGKLENGVITFGVGDMLISMAGYNSGAFYKGNTNGACQIVLPEGVTISSAPAAKAAKPAGMVSGLKAVPALQTVFERDPQPVKVKVSAAAPERRSKSNNRILVTVK